MAQNSGAPVIVAAIIVGASLIAASFFLRTSVVDATQELRSLNESIAQAATPPARPTAQARPGRPDPSRRYSVSTSGAPVKGNPDAKVAIVEFSDFQCPFCGRVTPTLDQIREEYGERVRIVFKHLPLPIHSKAPGAHAAAEAAHRQDRFWEMHDRIFADQAGMGDARYVEYAEEIGLDVEQFKRDLASAEVKKRIDSDVAEARRLGVSGTPGFFVNGRFLSGAQPFDAFKSLIDAELGQG